MITSEISKRVFLGFFMALTVGWVYPAISEGGGCGGGSCGGSESSCCFCHETKGEMRVLSNGDYHKEHAFGDFCVFCHGGNVEPKSKAQRA